MKRLFVILDILFCSFLWAQITVVGTTEEICPIPIGEGPSDAFYSLNEEGFHSLGSPIIDQRGQIVFLKSVGGKSSFIVIGNEKREAFPYQGNLSDFRLTGNRHFDSQQGIHIDITPLIYTDKRFYEYNYREKSMGLLAIVWNNRVKWGHEWRNTRRVLQPDPRL